MVADWFCKGCEQCRQAALTGLGAPLNCLSTSIEMHARLHRCALCQTFWMENEREAHVIDAEEARATFGSEAVGG